MKATLRRSIVEVAVEDLEVGDMLTARANGGGTFVTPRPLQSVESTDGNVVISWEGPLGAIHETCAPGTTVLCEVVERVPRFDVAGYYPVGPPS